MLHVYSNFTIVNLISGSKKQPFLITFIKKLFEKLTIQIIGQ